MTGSTVTASISSIPASKASEIKMMLSTDANKNKCVILVEGVDDRKFYGRFISDDTIEINVLNSCYHMPEILRLTNADAAIQDRVIGIKDADFDHITGKNHALDNLFVTDTHDWETMVMTETCESCVAMECLDKKEQGLFDQVLHHLVNYSFTKLYNEVEVVDKGKDGISFRGLKLSDFYDGENECDLKESLNTVKAHSNNARLVHFPSEVDISSFMTRYPNVNLYQLTCGHDVIDGIVCWCTKIKGRRPEAGKRDIARIFRTSYTIEVFRTTSLYQTIDAWGNSHGRKVWEA